MAGTLKESNRKSRNLLEKITGKAGVYVVTPLANWNEVGKDPQDKMHVKIGLAGNSKKGNLAGRFNQYLLCWPNGFYVFAVITTSTKDHARTTERAIHEYLNGKEKHIITGHSHDEEWFSLSRAEIDDTLNMLRHNQYTRYSSDHPKRPNKRVFIYTEILNLAPFQTPHDPAPKVVANATIGQCRIKPMPKSIIRGLDNIAKSQGVMTIRTSTKKPVKTTKAHPTGRGKKLEF